MLSTNLHFGRCLILVLLVASSASVRLAVGAPVVVRPRGLEFKENEWASQEQKEGGRFDNANLVDKKKTRKASSTQTAATTDSAAATTPNPWADDTSDALTTRTANAEVNVADASTSEGEPRWVWAILASLCVAGVGLACFSYYWSHARRAPSW